jgi:hypothetical protein
VWEGTLPAHAAGRATAQIVDRLLAHLIRFTPVEDRSDCGPSSLSRFAPPVAHPKNQIAIGAMIPARPRYDCNQPFGSRERPNHQEMGMASGAHNQSILEP